MEKNKSKDYWREETNKKVAEEIKYKRWNPAKKLS